MNSQPKKDNKIWKIVAKFLFLFAILMSFLMPSLILIQIVGTGYPELLKFLTVFKDRPIVTIITLLANVSLFSFLLQTYMNKDPEKADNIWKNVVQFLLLFVFLVSVLTSVLIVGTGYPELLKFLTVFKDRPIVTIITLLANVSLFSFLLQTYMNKDPEKADNIWKIIAYPVHFTIRLVARFLLLLAVLVIVLILIVILILPILILSILELLWKPINEFLWKPINEFLGSALPLWRIEQKDELISNNGTIIIMVITLLGAIGLIQFLFQKNIKSIWKYIKCILKPLSNIKKKISEVFWGKWLPKIDIKKSLRLTRQCYFSRILPSVKETFPKPLKLIFPVLILCIISAFGYIPIKIFTEWQGDIENKVTAIKADTDSIKADTANLMLLRSSGHSPAYLSTEKDTTEKDTTEKDTTEKDTTEKDTTEKDTTEKDTTEKDTTEKNTISFLLGYPPQGDLESKKGICPEGDNLIWLTLFKKAFLECAKDGQMNLKIQGFASAAPVTEKDSIKAKQAKSDSFNCEIANQRAEALIYFLTLADNKTYNLDSCKVALKDSSRWGHEGDKLCTRGRPHSLAWKRSDFTVTYDDSPRVQWKGPHFTVAYKPWKKYEEMAKAKPVQDSLRLDLEFLNRSVKITIEGDSCFTKALKTAP